MSDTYSEDDRQPVAVEYREPRDVEKGKGDGGLRDCGSAIVCSSAQSVSSLLWTQLVVD
jgi:hypothetical protein